MKIHTIPLRMSLAYLIESDAGMYLVDAGIRGEEKRILALMKDIGREDLRLIFITHAHLDHYGCAAALRRITGAPLAIHGRDEEAMAQGETLLGQARGFGRVMKVMLPLANPLLRPEPARADIVLDDGDDFSAYGLTAAVLHTPGHTMGSCTLLLENGTAFSGDLITNSGQPRMQRYFAEDWSLLPRSLERLQEQYPEIVYSGHGQEPIRCDELQAICTSNRPG